MFVELQFRIHPEKAYLERIGSPQYFFLSAMYFVMGKNLNHQPNKAVRFHKGFRVGHNDGIDHPSIYRLLIPSREQALLVDLLCNLVYLHPVVRGCQDKDYGFFDFHIQIYTFS